MKDNLEDKAGELANRPYFVEVILDKTTDGEPVYLARSPELEGCLGQGKTIEEAEINLKEARYDYIISLLEDDIPVPDPIPLATSTTSRNSKTVTLSNKPVETASEIKKSRKSTRLFEASLRT